MSNFVCFCVVLYFFFVLWVSANDNKAVSRVADAHVASTASFDKIAESATKLDD